MDNTFSPSPDGRVLVVGAAGVDLVGRLQGELQPDTSNPALIRSSFGGVARNVAENLARLGQPVDLLAAVGADPAGEQLLAYTEAAGVDVSAVLRLPGVPTSTYLAVLNASGELQFALDDMRAVAALSSAHLRAHADLFRRAALLFVDANLSPAALRTAVSLARRANAPVCADPTSFTLAKRLRPYLRDLYMVTPNSTEAGVLCGLAIQRADRQQALEAAQRLVSLGVRAAVVAQAEFGVCYASSHTSGHAPAMFTEIVDPTGGGDALTAALIFALLNGIPLDDAVRLGIAAAAHTLGYAGTVAPDLTLEKLYDRLSA
jgi:pseudouridine kinase